jgi:selenocysteine-specific elongation factor
MASQDSPPQPQPRQVVVGLAGHIDHGKSALVQQLTGAATDRRPEEQRRGMTVDLGFAHFDAGGFRFALVDVPGHDRFVHNMVSGATGVHLGLLVVAADDSVMPQTREHLDILDLLGVKGGAIAITKCDLADDAWLESVRGEIAQLVADTTFADVPMIPVSNTEGRGIDEIREALVARAAAVPPTAAMEGPFRMAVDRAFSLAGHGTIVTGTVRRGTVHTGESLLLLPQQTRVKVRHLERQGEAATTLSAGERAAINLSGIKVSEVNRGDELVTEHTCEQSQRLLIRLTVLPRAQRDIGDRDQLRLHVGTREVTARVRLPRSRAAPGERLLAVLDCQRPVVAEFGQPVILRRSSPAETVGGGPVLISRAARRDRLKRLWEIGERLASAEVGERVAAFVGLRGPTRPADILWPLEIGAPTSEVMRQMDELIRLGGLVAVSREAGLVLSADQWQGMLEQVRRQCERQSRRQHPHRWFPRAAIVQRLDKYASPIVAESAIDELARQNWLSSRQGDIALVERTQLSKRQQQLLEQVAADIVEAGSAPPLRKELAEKYGSSVKDLEPLLGRLEDDGRVVRLSEELAVTPQVLDRLLRSLREVLAVQPAVSVAELRDRWQVTRKHALPYLQYFDEQGCTVRSDTVRIAGPRLNSSLAVNPSK